VPREDRIARASAGTWGAASYLEALLSALEIDVPTNSVESVTARIIMNAKAQSTFLDNSSTDLTR